MANSIHQILRYMAKAYYRLFYFFYRIEKRGEPKNGGPELLYAIGALMPIIYFGFIDLMFIKYLFLRFIYNWHIMQYKSVAILIVIISALFNGVLFLREKRYLKIKEMFSNEDDDTRSIRSFYCILYSLFTMFGTIILVEIFGRPT